MPFTDKKTVTSLYIDKELREKVAVCAKKDKRNVNNYIIMAIEKQVEKDMKSNEKE